MTFYNTAALGPKGIAKRAAKDTGKAFIGVDVEAVAARASVVPDQQQLVRAQRIFKFKACQDGLGHFFSTFARLTEWGGLKQMKNCFEKKQLRPDVNL